MNVPYEIPSTCSIREPMAAPNTTKYKDVEMTGDATLCISVFHVRSISNL
jgi:hypothetical protein